MNIKNTLLIIIISATVIGCSNYGGKRDVETRVFDRNIENTVSESDYDLIAENLISVLAQLETTHPMQTTIQMAKPTTPFGKSLLNEIDDLGYGIQVVTGDLGDAFLGYKAELSQTESGYRNNYSIEVKGISIDREYTSIDGNVAPISPVTVSGGKAYDPQLDDGIFASSPDESLTVINIVESDIPEVIVYASSTTEKERIQSPTSSPIEFKNVYELQHSNFKSIFTNYSDIESHVLIFPNDSLVMGKSNKEKMTELAGNVNPDTDIVSVIGCSHGKSKLENGNQLLAEGRTQRVKESLMYAGITSELIYDEACWANKYWDEMAPRRGVMVTHKRVIN